MSLWVPPPRSRRLSCTPWSRADLNEGFERREGRMDMLEVDARLLQPYQEVKEIYRCQSGAIFFLDKKYVLKLLPAVLDVDAIVRTMRLAGRAVPVPRVHRHGRSGNSGYIIMDRVQGAELFDLRLLHRKYPGWVITARVEHSVAQAVRALQAQGISHFDLYSTNMFIDRHWRVAAIIDWEWAHSEPFGDEYLRRVETAQFRPHDWDYLFARCKPLGIPFVASPIDGAVSVGPQPYIAPGYGHVRPADVDHVLDPLTLAIQPPAAKRLVVIDYSNGSDTCHVVDPPAEGRDYHSIEGFWLAKLFTMEKTSPEVLQSKIPTMAYWDMTPQLSLSPDQEFARLLARERPDLVLLLNWCLTLSPTFFDAMSVHADLADETSLPVLLRVSVHVSPALLEFTNPGDEHLKKIVTVYTLLSWYGFPETTLYVHEAPPFDSSVAGAVERHRAAAQRWAVRTAVGRWGRREQHR